MGKLFRFFISSKSKATRVPEGKTSTKVPEYASKPSAQSAGRDRSSFQAFQFLRLPREIRDMIYNCVLDLSPSEDADGNEKCVQGQFHLGLCPWATRHLFSEGKRVGLVPPRWHALNLMLTCRQISQELGKASNEAGSTSSVRKPDCQASVTIGSVSTLVSTKLERLRVRPAAMKHLQVDVELAAQQTLMTAGSQSAQGTTDGHGHARTPSFESGQAIRVLFNLLNVLLHCGPSLTRDEPFPSPMPNIRVLTSEQGNISPPAHTHLRLETLSIHITDEPGPVGFPGITLECDKECCIDPNRAPNSDVLFEAMWCNVRAAANLGLFDGYITEAILLQHWSAQEGRWVEKRIEIGKFGPEWAKRQQEQGILWTSAEDALDRFGFSWHPKLSVLPDGVRRSRRYVL